MARRPPFPKMVVVAALTVAATTAGCAPEAPVVSGARAPSSRPAAAPSQPVDSKVLGPNGYGALGLGMKRADAIARGLLTAADPGAADPAGCTMHQLAGRQGRDPVVVYVSPRYGVVQIASAPDWRTPERIGKGSTLTQVKAAYRDLAQHVNGSNATVPGNPAASYRFMFDQQGKVTEFSLELRGKQCTN